MSDPAERPSRSTDGDEAFQPLPAEVLQEIEALADALICRLPALSDLSSLIDTARQVSIRGGQVEFAFDELMSLESLERNYVMHVLNALEFNKLRTAEVLGIDPSTLYRKLSRWGLESLPVASPRGQRFPPDRPLPVPRNAPRAH